MNRFAVLTSALSFAALPLFADDFKDTIDSALQAYDEGDIAYAIEELDYAKGLLNAMKTQELGQFLPEAPAGWTREMKESAGQAMGMFGGGSGTEAEYTDGDRRFSITIMADNPMVTAFGGMLGNAAMLGLKVERVGRQKFLNENGDLTGIVDGRILVKAEGADVATMLPVLEAIDFKELERFGR